MEDVHKTHPIIAMQVGNKVVTLSIKKFIWDKLSEEEREVIHHRFRDIGESAIVQMENALCYTVGSVRMKTLHRTIPNI